MEPVFSFLMTLALLAIGGFITLVVLFVWMWWLSR